MQQTGDLAAAIGGQVKDVATAAAAALWPLSDARREVTRMTQEGHARGEPCEIVYSLSFGEPADAERALDLACRSGFVVDDVGAIDRGFVTLRSRPRLRTFDLERTTARLSRIADSCGGFVALIGAADAMPDESCASIPLGAEVAA